MSNRLALREVPEADSYRRSGQWKNRTIADDARRRADAGHEGNLFLGDDRPSSLADILNEAEALVSALHELGLRQGDVFSFMLPNWPEVATINLAAAMGGFVINPIVPIYREAETSFILADCESRLIFIPSTFRKFEYAKMMSGLQASLPALRHVVTVRDQQSDGLCYEDLVAGAKGTKIDLPQVDPASLKMVMYTSGTTGRPKAVLHSHETLARAVAISGQHWGIGSDDVVLMPSPVTHISGYSNGIERPFLGGTRTVLMEEWRADQAVSLIDRFGATMTVAATPFLQELAVAANLAGSCLPTLRCFACGGAAIPSAVIRQANGVFAQPAAFRVYGSSEAPFVTLGFIGEASRELAAVTDGEIVDYTVRVVDEDGREVSVGEDGEILVKGPALFMGYANPADTSESFTPDGFFRTGDIGRVDAGTLTITDRKKDLIIRGGENISAKEIEDALHQHPAVAEAAVVAMPHARLGEGVCAFLILSTSGDLPDTSDLVRFLDKLGLARQKAPERIVPIDAFPRTAAGKVRKDQLRSYIESIIENEAMTKKGLSRNG